MYAIETLGTTIFMLAALTGNWLVIGYTLLGLLYIGTSRGVVCYNPGIVLTLCALEKMSWKEGVKYLGCEAVGIIIAIILYKVVTY